MTDLKFPKVGSLTYLWQLQKTWAASENVQGIAFTEGLQFSCFIVKPRFQEYFVMSHWREILGSGTPHSQIHWEFESEIYWLAYLGFGRLLGYMEKCCTTEVGVVWTYKLCLCVAAAAGPCDRKLVQLELGKGEDSVLTLLVSHFSSSLINWR